MNRRIAIFLFLLMITLLSCSKVPVIPEAERFTDRSGDRICVIVHSRTGNTAHMGKIIARELGADFIWLKETSDHNNDPAVEPVTVDLSTYQLIFLGSPVWYGLQTKFINAFVQNNRLDGKSIVLFNTYGGHSRDNFPGVWMNQIVESGGQVVDHIAVRRVGRTPQQVDVEIYGLVASRLKRWLAASGLADDRPEEGESP